MARPRLERRDPEILVTGFPANLSLVDRNATRRTSKLLSLILRHRPDDFGVVLDGEGWTEIEELLGALARNGTDVSENELLRVVRDNDKQRFAVSPDGRRIRAQQGHSVAVELGYAETEPPPVLFHGTVARSLPSIRREGLTAQGRHHVHLSETVKAAERVGQRRGVPIVLEVRSGAMAASGLCFYVTPNGVWLTDRVDPCFIRFPAK